MTDLRSLLLTAAEPVAEVRPPDVADLVARRRRRAAIYRAGAALGAVAIVLAVTLAAELPARRVGNSAVATRPSNAVSGPPSSGVTVGQLTSFRWRALPRAPIAARDGAAVVWTGRQVIVWGGARGDHDLVDGAAYDPARRSWTKLPASPLPSGYVQAVWTGRTMLVWGTGRGAIYDPEKREWQLLPPLPHSSASGVSALVERAGHVVLITARPYSTVVHAHAYEPGSNHWRSLADIALPASHEAAELVALAAGGNAYLWVEWSHTSKVGWNDYETSAGVDAFRLDGAWRATPVAPDSGMSASGAVATDGSVYFPQRDIWCGFCPGPMRSRYQGATVDTRTYARSSAPALGLVGRGSYVSTGSALLVLNTTSEASGPNGTKPGDLAAWQPGLSRWTRLPSAPLRRGDLGTVAWAGDRLFVWGQEGGLEFAHA